MRYVLNYAYQSQKLILTLLIFVSPWITSLSLYAQEQPTFKPFVLAEQNTLSLAEAKEKVRQQIIASPFSVVAEFEPYGGAYIFIITSDELKTLTAKARYGGFAAPQRISLTKVGPSVQSSTQVAFTNPVFMQHAFRMSDIDLQPILDQMTEAFGFQQYFGGDGLTAKKLKRYRYSFGLEDFDAFYELPKYGSHAEAIAALEKGFQNQDNGISKVFKLEIPGKQQVVFGVAMNAEDSGDEALNTRKTMDVIDHMPLKRTAYLPYEIMVDGQQILALHARFRIAVNFYDLKMFGKHGFGKLFSTPTAYQKAFFKASGGTLQQMSPTEEGFIN